MAPKYKYLAIGGAMSAAASGATISEAMTKCILAFPEPHKGDPVIHRVVVWKLPIVSRENGYGHPELPENAQAARIVFEGIAHNHPEGPRWYETAKSRERIS
jgi:hypothetical protein